MNFEAWWNLDTLSMPIGFVTLNMAGPMIGLLLDRTFLYVLLMRQFDDVNVYHVGLLLDALCFGQKLLRATQVPT